MGGMIPDILNGGGRLGSGSGGGGTHRWERAVDWYCKDEPTQAFPGTTSTDVDYAGIAGALRTWSDAFTASTFGNVLGQGLTIVSTGGNPGIVLNLNTLLGPSWNVLQPVRVTVKQVGAFTANGQYQYNAYRESGGGGGSDWIHHPLYQFSEADGVKLRSHHNANLQASLLPLRYANFGHLDTIHEITQGFVRCFIKSPTIVPWDWGAGLDQVPTPEDFVWAGAQGPYYHRGPPYGIDAGGVVSDVLENTTIRWALGINGNPGAAFTSIWERVVVDVLQEV